MNECLITKEKNICFLRSSVGNSPLVRLVLDKISLSHPPNYTYIPTFPHVYWEKTVNGHILLAAIYLRR